MQIESISVTFSVENTARADMMLTSSRVYYRFATIDTCEEGEMPYDDAIETINKINISLTPSEGEAMPQDVKCTVDISYIDGSKKKYDNNNINLDSYNSIINIISRISEEFLFVRGFK